MSGRCPRLGNLYLLECAHSLVHRILVHLDDLLAFFPVGLLDGVFHVAERLFRRDDIGNFEKSGLHDHVDPGAETETFADILRIYIVKADPFLRDGPFHAVGEVHFHVLLGPCGIEQE